MSETDPVALIGARQAQFATYRCPHCRAIERHPTALPTFGAKCGSCAGTISSRDVFQYARFPRRVFAAFIDIVAFALPTVSIDLIIGAWAIDYAPKDIHGDPTFAARVWITFALAIFTSALLLAYMLRTNARGRSPGKMLTGLRAVRRENGDMPGLSRCITRTSAQFLTVLTLGVGYAMAGFDPQRRTLHDRIAGTIVIEK